MRKALWHCALIPLPEHEPERIGAAESVLPRSSREWMLRPDSVPSPSEHTSIAPESAVAVVAAVAVVGSEEVEDVMEAAFGMWTDAARTRCSDSPSCSPPILALDSSSSNADPGTFTTAHSIYATL